MAGASLGSGSGPKRRLETFASEAIDRARRRQRASAPQPRRKRGAEGDSEPPTVAVADRKASDACARRARCGPCGLLTPPATCIYRQIRTDENIPAAIGRVDGAFTLSTQTRPVKMEPEVSDVDITIVSCSYSSTMLLSYIG